MATIKSRLAALESKIAPKLKLSGQALLIHLWGLLLHEQPDFRAMVRKRRLEQLEKE